MNKIKRFIVIFAVICFLAVGLGMNMDAQEKEEEPTQEQIDMYKRWLSLTSPGESHKHLQYFVGEWESIQKIWQEPGKDPIVRHQDISVESLYEGRFTRARIRIREKIMGIQAEGIVLTGYDSYQEKFVSVTFGNMGTRFSLNSGHLDKSGKIRIDTGENENILNGEKSEIKAVTTIIDQDKYTYDYYEVDKEGKEIKIMEITYNRKK